ncbi:MAG TPA: helix-turn-helix transcriptional regulator [Mycobacteriales bacterium]|nr:helix-turn-helix transcriptional regulator [Mycobacteriales bacterium]
MTEQAARRRELAAFLRSRRERIGPALAGLPEGGRRRTPGLRREEVAQLAGVGVTWYTWLEQGRPINASTQVLKAISRVLRLDEHERTHLFTLAGAAPPAQTPEPDPVSTSMRGIVAALDPLPARVVNARWDLLAYNRAELGLMGDYRVLPDRQRNVMRLLFTEPAWRKMLLDWDSDSRRLIAQFRAATVSHLGEPAWTELVEDLSARSPEFRDLWEQHDVAGSANRVKRYLHPTVGLLSLESSTLWLSERPGARLTIYTPCDDATRSGLEKLAELEPFVPWTT